jgi:hypothetical protein
MTLDNLADAEPQRSGCVWAQGRQAYERRSRVLVQQSASGQCAVASVQSACKSTAPRVAALHIP